MYNHYKRIQNTVDEDEVELQKKQYSLNWTNRFWKITVSDISENIRCTFCDRRCYGALTEAGYVGEDVENIAAKIGTSSRL